MSRVWGFLAVMAAALACAPVGSAADSRTELWSNQAGTVECGFEAHAPGTNLTHVLCAARGLPRPSRGVGDPFVEISATGRPKVVRRSQYSWASMGTADVLKKGAQWRSGMGVRCAVLGRTVRCSNRSRHGFTVGSGRFKAF